MSSSVGVEAAHARGLPVSARPLVGRAREVDGVLALLVDERARLVTLVGPGGVGKTRLALAVADRLHDNFGDGVRFVDLAPVREPAFVLTAIAQTLSVREATGAAAGANADRGNQRPIDSAGAR